MGLLDEAIREHLDLKRRRGADPAEVERAEREALGPVRRNPGPGASAEPEEADSAAGGLAYDQDDDREWATEGGSAAAGESYDELADGEFEDEYLAGDQPVSPRAERGPAPAVPNESGEPDDLEDWSAAGEGEFAAEPFPTTSGSRHRAADVSDETTEFNVEQHQGFEDEPDEDMLEETPEFLQDTPDHDRLWFEQRPPRDFDFDN